ncbi:MFS transporter [Paenibacillus piri]|uniref:MFS transporter n=1 Tax=Paenibacillus piri TaxID=2547395 RepID=A0A4R5KHZ1_9BACL|nr:MFS transporter [Paenibacillus piri]TDF95053.1 MFS transporter [Paenibacillus piri]
MERANLDGGKIWTKPFLLLSMSSFFMFLNFYMLATTLPLFVKDVLGGSQQQMGLVITLYVVGNVLFRPFSGRWVDRFGKKKMAVLSLAVFFIASLLYLGTYELALLLMVRIIHGASYGVASTATSAIAADIVPASRKGEGIGYFSMFMSIAMVIGPALGLVLWNASGDTALLGTGLVVSLCSLLLAMALRMPLEDRKPEQAMPRTKWTWSNLIEKKALPVSMAGFVLAFSYSSLTAFMSSYTIELHQSGITSYFFICFAVMIVLSRPLIGKVFDKYSEHYLAYPGIVLFIVGMVLVSQAQTGWMLLAAGAIMGLGYGALLPCFQTLAMKLAPAHRTGLATGTFFLFFDLGYGFGSYVLGLIAAGTNYRTMFLAASIIVLLSAVIYYVFHHRAQLSRKPVLAANK